MIKKLISGLIFFLLPILSFASGKIWHIDPDKSWLRFTATQNGAPLTGEFNDFSGDIQFDPQHMAESHVKITVTMSSASAAYKEVTDLLKTESFFNPKKFPKAVFISNSFSKLKDMQYDVKGHLTLLNKTLPMTLHFTLEKYNATEAIAQGNTSMKRLDFGVGKGEWSSTNQVENDVAINFLITAKSADK